MAYIRKAPKFGVKKFSGKPSFGGPRRVSFGASKSEGSAERFQANCAQCHEKCEVPFRPNGKKPVYCRNCFKGKEEGGVNGNARAFSPTAAATPNYAKQFEDLNAKLDRLIALAEGR